jgi:archaellum biogenesis protein FlaJ (TadC family)
MAPGDNNFGRAKIITQRQEGPSMKEAREYYEEVLSLLERHHRWFSEALPLIASENVPSPAVREALASDFGNRYAERVSTPAGMAWREGLRGLRLHR